MTTDAVTGAEQQRLREADRDGAGWRLGFAVEPG
jgi:hypothetical protein